MKNTTMNLTMKSIIKYVNRINNSFSKSQWNYGNYQPTTNWNIQYVNCIIATTNKHTKNSEYTNKPPNPIITFTHFYAI